MNWQKIIINRFYYSSNNIGSDTSIFSMIGMGVGCFAMIIALSVMNGFEGQVHERLKGFEGDLNILNILPDNDFSNIQEIDLAMPYMERKGVIKTYETNLIVTIKAVDEKLMQEFYDIPIIGDTPKTGQVIIGVGLANRLGKNLHDEITLYSPIDQVYGFGFPPIKKMKISGIFSTKILNYDDYFIFITLNDGRNLFKRKSTYDGFDIKISDDAKIENVKAKILDMAGYNVNIKSWRENNRSLVEAMRMERLGAIAILGLIFLVASFNLSSSLILLSIKKMKEVGIIRVIGAPKFQIMRIMVYLGIKKAIRGAVVGMVIALLIIHIQNIFLFIPLPSNIYFIDYLPMKLKLTDLILVFIMVSAFIISSSYFSAKKIVDLKLTEALQWIK
tara:strand:+ start:189 stop:1355 length:1167 start_codon:yes stop_codon:yes gene_type:complete